MDKYTDIKVEKVGDRSSSLKLGSRVLVSNIHGYNLKNTLECGQIFRFKRVNETYYINHGKELIRVRQADEDHLVMDGEEGDVRERWLRYLGIEDRYDGIGRIARELVGSEYLNNAIAAGNGIKIMHQDPWEMIVSFIISQRSSIPKIKSTIEKICNVCGEKMVHDYSGTEYKAFPDAIQLLHGIEENRGELGLGYREDYLYKLAYDVSTNIIDIEKLGSLGYEEVIAELKGIRGIGDKVANCIALFGLGHTSAFPIDVWIQRVIDDEFSGNFDYTIFGEYAGIVQQYLFFSKHNLKR